MKDKKRKHPKSPEHIGNANKGPKKSDSSISGYLITDTRGGIIYTPAARPSTPTYQDCEWRGDPTPDAPTPSPSKSAEQIATTPSKPIGKITSADIASISSWKPKFTLEQLLSQSNSLPASQDSESSEGNQKSQKKTRISAPTFEPKLETIPLPTPAPLASIPEVVPSEEALLTPIMPPTHVEHAPSSLPSLSQILDKESQHQMHATEHATLNDPISTSKSDHTSDTFIPSSILLTLLQGQQTLIRTITKMEAEISSLKEDNTKLQSFIHKEISKGINHLTLSMAEHRLAIELPIKTTSENLTQNFELIQRNTTALEEKVVSIEQKLASTAVEQKLDNLETTVKDLLFLKPDTLMDTTCQG